MQAGLLFQRNLVDAGCWKPPAVNCRHKVLGRQGSAAMRPNLMPKTKTKTKTKTKPGFRQNHWKTKTKPREKKGRRQFLCQFKFQEDEMPSLCSFSHTWLPLLILSPTRPRCCWLAKSIFQWKLRRSGFLFAAWWAKQGLGDHLEDLLLLTLRPLSHTTVSLKDKDKEIG